MLEADRLKDDILLRSAVGSDAASVAEVLIRSRAEYLP
jgi:hypothetical protein